MNENWKDDEMDDLLRQSIGRETAEFDAESWTTKNPDAVAAFKGGSAGGVDPNLNMRFWRTIMNLRKFKILAPAAVAAAVVVMVIIWAIGGNPKIALANTIELLRGKSYECVMDVHDKNTDISFKMMVMEPGKLRISGEAPKTGTQTGTQTVIVDGDKALVVIDKMKLAMLLNLKDHMDQSAPPDAFSLTMLMDRSISSLWNLQTGSEKKLERRKIGGVEADGFVITQKYDASVTMQTTVWADAKTAFPLSVEIAMKSEKEKEPMTMTLKEFKIIEKPDASLFALKAPKGYRMSGYQTLKELAESRKDLKTTPEAQKIVSAISLWSEDKKDQAIESLLSVDWKGEMKFSFENYLFSMSEDDYVSLVGDDIIKADYFTPLSYLRGMAKELQSGSIKARDAKDYAQAEKLLNVMERLGELCKGEDKLFSVEQVGIALRRIAATEKVALYEAQGDAAKVEAAKKQVKEAEEDNEAMKKRVKEMSPG